MQEIIHIPPPKIKRTLIQGGVTRVGYRQQINFEISYEGGGVCGKGKSN